MIDEFIKIYFSKETKDRSLMRMSIRQSFVSCITLVGISAVLMILFFLIGRELSTKDSFFGVTLTLNGFLLQILFFVLVGVLVSFPLSFIRGFNDSRIHKNSYNKILEALLAISKGKLNYRMDRDDFREVSEISEMFNNMILMIQQQVESLQRLVNENRKLLQGIEEAATVEERRKIARELHDAISQQLFAMSMTLSAMPRLIDSNPEKAKLQFDKITMMVHTAQQELRALIMHLRPVHLEGESLSSGVEKLLEELAAKNPAIKLEWRIDKLPPIDDGVEENLYRVIQEGISNALRHSKASIHNIKVLFSNNLLSVFIEDNGVGFDTNQSKKSSYGLSTMKERVLEIGGRINVISYPKKGTRIEIRVPIRFEEAKDE